MRCEGKSLKEIDFLKKKKELNDSAEEIQGGFQRAAAGKTEGQSREGRWG